MRPIELTAEARDVLAFIRRTEFPLSVYGRSAARVWPMVREQVNQRISRFGVPVHEVNIYRRYVAEMLKAFRTETGEPLARALELCVRKWTNLGLEPELLQQLLCDCHRKFHSTGHQMPRAKPLVPAKKTGPRLRRKHKRTYAEALRKGRTSRGPAATIEEQSARHAEGIARNRDISQSLAVLLKDRRIPGQEFVRYNAFAQKLGRLTRKHGGRTLQLAASDLIDLYEAKQLDPEVLARIRTDVFDVDAPKP
jgi:hypothetical protein